MISKLIKLQLAGPLILDYCDDKTLASFKKLDRATNVSVNF